MWKFKDIPDFGMKYIVLSDIDEKYVLLEDGRVWSRSKGDFITLTKDGLCYPFYISSRNTLTILRKDMLVKRYFCDIDKIIGTEYKPVYNNPSYFVTRDGRIFSTRHYKFIKACVAKQNWPIVCLLYGKERKSILLAKIVWEAYNGPLDKKYKLVYKDNNKLNVCLDNLDIEMKSIYKTRIEKEVKK